MLPATSENKYNEITSSDLAEKRGSFFLIIQLEIIVYMCYNKRKMTKG